MSKIALCAIGRLENRYAREFVEHYLRLGVEKFFIYDNNHFNEEFFEEVLQDYIDQGIVEIINYRNVIKPQMKAYTDCYLKHGNEYDWFLFVDFDEYLVLNKHKTIQEFVEDKKYYECVLINWMCMTDSNLIQYEDKPLMERFTEACDKDICVQYKWPENMHVKSLIRGGLPNVSFYGNPHTVSTNILCCNADGIRCDNRPWQPISWETAYLKHFTTKSLQEYCENKLKKGTADRDYNCFKSTYQSRYFKYNKLTKEKLKFLKDNGYDWI